MDAHGMNDISQWVRRIDERVDQVQEDMGNVRAEMALIRQTIKRLEGNLRTAYRIGWGLLVTTLVGPMLAHWLSTVGL